MSRPQPWDFFPLFPVYAFSDLKKCAKFVKKKTGMRFNRDTESGTFELYSNQSGEKFAVIYIDGTGLRPMQKYAVLAHECVHYMQYYAKDIGQKRLDKETAAYVVQSAMYACTMQIGEEWFNATPQA